MAHRNLASIILLSLAASVPAAAQWGRNAGEEIRPRFRSTDRNQESGWCKLRIRVDGEVIVTMQRDRVQVRPVSGQPASDEGSECSSPLPAGGFSEFDFDKTDGRGQASVEEPLGPSNPRLILRVRDGDGGSDKYTLEFKWRRDPNVAARDRQSGDYGRNRGSSFDLRDACRQELRNRLANNGRAQVGRQLEETIRPGNGPREELTGRAEAVLDGQTRIVEYRCVANPRQGRIIDFNHRFVESRGLPARRR